MTSRLRGVNIDTTNAIVIVNRMNCMLDTGQVKGQVVLSV